MGRILEVRQRTADLQHLKSYPRRYSQDEKRRTRTSQIRSCPAIYLQGGKVKEGVCNKILIGRTLRLDHQDKVDSSKDDNEVSLKE